MANQFYLAIARAMKSEADRLNITVEALADQLEAQQNEMDRDGTAGKYSSDRGVLWAKKEKAANG